MLDPSAIPSVDQDESVARFVFSKRYLRTTDNTVKPEAFIPHPYADTSVTRHRDATVEELWNEGRRIEVERRKSSGLDVTLYGRADSVVTSFIAEGLSVVHDPVIPENPNHAIVTGWPSDKSAQKAKAMQISIDAKFLNAP